MIIKKSDGAEQEFKAEKLARALTRAKVPETATKEIVFEIEKLLRPGTTTHNIYERALHLLEARDPLGAARFTLKHAMMELGPTGFPFEQYFARLMEAYGWKTQVGATVSGKCVKHEVDVYAERGEEKRAVEAKYHNQSSGRTDVKVALYVHARHLDLSGKDPSVRGVLVTNTEFTSEAIAYGECVEMKMKAWNYPRDRGLAYYIESKCLYPITVFSSLPKDSARALVQDGRVLASELISLTDDAAAHYKISEKVFETLKEQASALCEHRLE